MDSSGAGTLAERVVAETLAAYAALPAHGKPAVRDNGVREWTVLASMSLTRSGPTGNESVDGSGICGSGSSGSAAEVYLISLGTGVKVLPAARLPPLGDTLHDSHAEVLARRGLRRWLLAEATRVLGGEASVWVIQDKEKFALAPGVQVWLYVSALPCGDASTLHTTAHQPASMAARFRDPDAPAAPTPGEEGTVRGRRGYETYGAIRTKPGRADAPPSICLSCSDKIAAWNVLGLQGAISPFAPVYLDYIVVGGVETPEGVERAGWEEEVVGEVRRALYGRLESIKDSLPGGYRLATPKVHLTPTPFPLSKPAVVAAAVAAGGPDTEPSTSSVCLSHVPALGKPEVLINGCVGANAWRSPGTKPLRDKQRSRLSRLEIMRAYAGLMAALGGEVPDIATYGDVKRANASYTAAKRVLRGDTGGELSEAWRALLPHAFPVTTGEAPFAGWIASGERYESFTRDGRLKLDS